MPAEPAGTKLTDVGASAQMALAEGLIRTVAPAACGGVPPCSVPGTEAGEGVSVLPAPAASGS